MRLVAVGVAVGADALGDLILMVREDQVDAAAVTLRWFISSGANNLA